MSIVRVSYMPEFHFGDHVVLVTLDGDGVDEIRAELDEALREGLCTKWLVATRGPGVRPTRAKRKCRH